MKDKTANIFEDTECISEERMYAYINKQLTAKERHLVERHLLDCELCADALEGFSLMKNTETTRSAVVELNKQISNPLLPEKKVFSWMNYRWSIAAAVAFLIIAGSVILLIYNPSKDQKETQLADQFDIKKAKDAPVAGDFDSSNKKVADATIQAQEKNLEQSNVNVEREKSSSLKLAESDAPTATRKPNNGYLSDQQGQYKSKIANKDEALALADEAADKIKINESANIPIISNIEITTMATGSQAYIVAPMGTTTYEWKADKKNSTTLKNVELAKSSKKKSAEKYAAAPSAKPDNVNKNRADVDSKKKLKGEAKPNDEPAKDIDTIQKNGDIAANSNYRNEHQDKDIQPILDSAMRSFDLKDYARAIPLFKRVLTQMPNNISALVHQGIAYYFVAKPDSANLYLDKALKDKTSADYETALFYKALALMQQKKNSEAKKILKDVIGRNGSWSQLAQDSLLKMGK